MDEEWLLYGEPADVIGEPTKVFARFGDEFILFPIELLDDEWIDTHEVVPGEINLGMVDGQQYFDAVDAFEQVDVDELVGSLETNTVFSQREAEMVVLGGWFDMSRREIATELGIEPNTVDNHLRAARDRLERAIAAVEKSSGF